MQSDSGDQNVNHESIDTVIKKTVLTKVRKAMVSGKIGKAVGCHDLPAEVLSNEAAYKFMFKLLYVRCFESGIVLSIWKKGIINPIPYNPMNYCAISTLACAMYKIYCSILKGKCRTI